MWQSLQQYVKVVIWAVIAGLTWALLSPAVHEAGSSIFKTVFSRLSPASLCLAVLGLLVVCVVLLALLYEARSQARLLRRYEHDPDFPELWRHRRRNGERVCPRCLLEGHVSPIQITEQRWIACQRRNCGFKIEHPKHKEVPTVLTAGVPRSVLGSSTL
jgi:uncharacterized membrane protein YcjF (UPF0283 family)